VASTYAGDKLTEEHRRQQVRLAAVLAEVIGKLFDAIFDWRRIDESSEEFVRRAAVEVARFREASRMLSVDYLHAFHAVEAPDADPPIDEPSEIDEVEIMRELLATARGVSKTLSRKGYDEDEAVNRTQQAVIGKATKLAGDGGRQVIETEVRRGNGPVGYARVVDADPCPFCAMLASRGLYFMGADAPGVGLYRSDAFEGSNARFVGDGRFKVHDHCCCTMEPVYRVDGKINLPGKGNELAKEWAEVASGQDDPWLAWQRWRESGTLPENYDGPLDGKRRPAPVHGQSTGRRKRPKPAKASERKQKPNATVGDWDAARYLEYADELEKRANGVAEEIATLKQAGQSDDDIAVMALAQEHRALLSRIDRYRKRAAEL
jgi:hypothetical protein